MKFDGSEMRSSSTDNFEDDDTEFEEPDIEDTADDFLPSPSDLDVDLSGDAEEID